MNKRTKVFIVRIPNTGEDRVLETKRALESIFGWVVLRGRHRNRKAILGNEWRKYSQNDIPWRKAEFIDVYLHPKNPNYQRAIKREGIVRKNTML